MEANSFSVEEEYNNERIQRNFLTLKPRTPPKQFGAWAFLRGVASDPKQLKTQMSSSVCLPWPFEDLQTAP